MAEARLDRASERWILVALALLVVFELILGIAWLRIDATPPYWDEAWYLHLGLAQWNALRTGGLPAWYGAWTTLDPTRPSLVSALTVPLFAVFGPSGDAGLLVNLAAWVVLLLATFGLGSEIAGQRCGLLAALLVGSYPILIGLVHILLVEMVMVALVAATLYALWRSHGFEELGWSLTAGFLVGLGLLTKVFFITFVVGPWLVTALAALRGRGRRPLRARNGLLSLAIAAALAATWYMANFRSMLERTISAGVGTEGAPYGPAAPLHWDNLVRYLVRFAGQSTSFAAFLILLVATAALLVALLRFRKAGLPGQRPDGHALLFLGSSILVGYALFTSLNNQDMKHSTGILPAIAVVSAWGISILCRRRWAIAAVAVAALAVVQVVAGTLPAPLGLRSVSVQVLDEPLYLFYPAQPHVANTRYARPDGAHWPVQEILRYAVQAAGGEAVPGRRVRVGIIPDYPGIEAATFIFEADRLGIPAWFMMTSSANLANQDVLIHKTGDWGWLVSVPAIQQQLASVQRADSEWQRMDRTFPLPDGSAAIIFVRSEVAFLPEAPQPQYPVREEFGGAARFLGYNVVPGTDAAGRQVLTFSYFWESLGPTQGDYKVFVHLLEPGTDRMVAQDDHPLGAAVYPTGRWQPGRFLLQRRTVPLPPDYGGSQVIPRLGLYDEAGRLPITGPGGTALLDATFIDLGPVSLQPTHRVFVPLVTGE
jgi:4-amino-4-deoxy-L-arabinose transferase-like glycosyltransferase